MAHIKRDKSYYLFSGKKGENALQSSNKGKISNTLSRAIASKREPELFDTPEITQRDTEVKKLNDILCSDKEIGLDRKGKPVFLTSYQNRIIHALSYAISQDVEEEDVRGKIRDPFKSGNPITRNLNITEITKLIFGSTRKRYKTIVIRNLIELSHIRQYQIIESGDRKVRLSAPLLQIGKMVEDLSPEKRDNLDAMEVTFGTAFFVDLDKRFAVITPKLFEVWSKGGRGTELFSVLLDTILSVYWQYKQAANKAEDRVKTDKQYKGLSKAERDKEITKAKRYAMTFELNIASIKSRVTTDYESTRQMKKKFWKDLKNSIDGFKELDLIEEAKISKGANGQDKVSFILSESYNYFEKSNSTKLLDEPIDDGEPSPF